MKKYASMSMMVALLVVGSATYCLAKKFCEGQGGYNNGGGNGEVGTVSWNVNGDDCCEQTSGAALVNRRTYVNGQYVDSSYYVTIAQAQNAAGCPPPPTPV